MDRVWWNLPGPCRFVAGVAQDLESGKNVLLALPDCAPAGLDAAVEGRIRERDQLRFDRFSAALADGGVAHLVERLHGVFAPPDDPALVLSVLTLAGSAGMAGRVVWVKADETSWPVWRDFLFRYQHACHARAEWDRGLFCVVARGSLADDIPQPDVTLSIRRWRGAVSSLDLTLDLAGRVECRHPHRLHRQVALALAVELAGNDGQLARELIEQDLLTLLNPRGYLEQYAQRLGWSNGKQGWSGGQVDEVDGAEVIHSAALAVAGEAVLLERRIWNAEVRILFPFLEQERIRLLPLVKPYFRLPVPTAQGMVHDLHDLELGELHHHLRISGVSREVWERLCLLVEMRHALAHLKPVPERCLYAERVLRSWES